MATATSRPVNVAGTLAFTSPANTLVSGTMNGAGTLTQASTGTTTLSSYQGTGPINVNNGQITLATSSSIRQTGEVTGVSITNNSGTSCWTSRIMT